MSSLEECKILSFADATVDPEFYKIEDKNYQDIFMQFHKIIIDHGPESVKDVGKTFEFVVQLENDAPLKIDKGKMKHFVDYIDFTIDLQHDQGKIYVGSQESSKQSLSKDKSKANVKFEMRDQDFLDLLAG